MITTIIMRSLILRCQSIASALAVLTVVVLAFFALYILTTSPTPAQSQAAPSEGGCSIPAQLAAPRSVRNQGAPPEAYASAVVGSIDVISPEYALGMDDSNWAVLTETSVLTLSFQTTFNSGNSLHVYHPMQSSCEVLVLYIAHYAALDQMPLTKTVNDTGMSRGSGGFVGDGYALFIPLHQYIVITTNTMVWIDAATYTTPPRKWWLPVVMNNSTH